jgi:hypothetical protein
MHVRASVHVGFGNQIGHCVGCRSQINECCDLFLIRQPATVLDEELEQVCSALVSLVWEILV